MTSVADGQPSRGLPIEHVDVPLDHNHASGLGAEADHIVLSDPETRNIHPPAIDVYVAVINKLSCLGPRRSYPGSVDDVIEAKLEEAQHILAGNTISSIGLLVEAPKLFLGETVRMSSFLFLLQLDQVLRRITPTPCAAMFARRHWGQG